MSVRVQQSTITSSSQRVVALDALRGFALCGIVIVNIYQQVLGRAVHPGQLSAVLADAPSWVQWGFVGRFYPIFAVLFGIGFALFLDGAGRRTDRPRLVLARRLLVLLALGLVHWVFHPGEVLTMYAISGLVVLLPLSYARAKVVLAVSIVLLVVGSALVGQAGMIPGLIALGFALGRLGVMEVLQSRPRPIAITLAVSLVVAIGLGVLIVGQVVLPSALLARWSGAAWGVAMALSYATTFVLLLFTPVGPVLSAMFAPMGRMALTNYLSATALMLIFGPLIGIDGYDDVWRIVALAVAINVGQMIISAVWLRHFRFGPLEWVWRCLTWWQLAPLRSDQSG